MATGLNESMITFSPGLSARSSDVNANFVALNTASNFTFSTNQIDPAQTPDSSFRGMKMLTASDFGLLNDTNSNFLRIASGMTASSVIALTDRNNNLTHAFWTDGSAFDYICLSHTYLRVKVNVGNSPNTGGSNAFRVAATNVWNISGTNYGFIAAAAATFNQGSSNADIAEPLLTKGKLHAGMAVCIVENDTVGACVHVACHIAKIISTAPTILLTPRIDDDLNPLEGHESAMPIVIGGVAPVLMVDATNTKLRDRVTPAGPEHPGMLRVARENEFALGDVVRIEGDTIYAWIHY